MIPTNRIAIFKDGSEYEVFQNFSEQDFIDKDGKTVLLKDVKPGDYKEEIVALPKIMVTPLEEDWSLIRINFNFPAWELVKNNQFSFSEREDGFDLELFEPVTTSKNMFRISRRNRSIEFNSKVIDCQPKIWYPIIKKGNDQFSINV